MNTLITLSSGGSGGKNVIIKDEGTVITSSVDSIDFVGALVTATAVGNDVTVDLTQTCTTEFIKIAAHSFFMVAQNDTNKLFYGFFVNSTIPVWSGYIYNYNNAQTPFIRRPDIATTIPIPTNLFQGDTVILRGSAYIENFLELTQNNYKVQFASGIFSIDCRNPSVNIPSYTFMPVSIIDVTEELGNFDGKVCFENKIDLTSVYDARRTRLLVGFAFFITCNEGPGSCGALTSSPNSTVSYTLDIERPCQIATTNCFIIKNCCEPTVTELVNLPNAVIGSFLSDSAGNCWEVISESFDVTNYTRDFNFNYTSCSACITANPCPENFVITSCCVMGYELVSASLPGLNVGTTFVDDNGLCWYVDNTSGAPVSEESITVSSIIVGDCDDCILANPCPTMYYIQSCCNEFAEVIPSLVSMEIDDVFVDNFGVCWQVIDKDLLQLPTNYNINVVTVYPGGGPSIPCIECTTVNPCPPYYYLTVRHCCDPFRVEVIEIPSFLMIFEEGSIFGDPFGQCWEIMSYSTIGTPTYFYLLPAKPNKFKDCNFCIKKAGGCINTYEVMDCNGTVFTALVYYSTEFVTIIFGNYYFDDDSGNCYQIIGYADTVNPSTSLKISITTPGQINCATCLNPVMPFTTVWTLGDPNTIILPYLPLGTYSGTIDWGDGNIEVNSYANRTHSYATAGAYTVVITGDCIGWNFSNPPAPGDFPSTSQFITSVVHWGQLQLGDNSGGYFGNCYNLDLSTVSDVLNLTGITSLASMFYNIGTAAFTSVNRINEWDVTAITNMNSMFSACTHFNQALNMNTSAVTDMNYMFANCYLLNSALVLFTQSVTSMDGMFFGCVNFDQDLSTFNVSSLSSAVYFMSDKTPATFSTANLDAIYNGWSTQIPLFGVTISFGTAKYTIASAAGKATLTGAYSWYITDGGI